MVFGLLGRCHEIPIRQPSLNCILFDALVHPRMTYACEVWAIAGLQKAMDEMESILRRFLKMLLGVSSNTFNTGLGEIRQIAITACMASAMFKVFGSYA